MTEEQLLLPAPVSVITADIKAIGAILKLKRVHGGASEKYLIENFIKPLGAVEDKYGNFILEITDPNGKRGQVLWCSHTDTVHRTDGIQKLLVDANGVLSADEAECLGADDGAGIWLMTEMIEAGVPGVYIFHRDEETGCHGSKYIAAHEEEYKDLFDNIKFAIAFDRRGTNSIITHQGSRRTCSDAFADSLAGALDMGLTKDTGGSFTDTKSYVDMIGECTNISVGYQGAHTSHESLDTKYLAKLRDALIAMDQGLLVQSRKPDDKPEWSSSNYNWSSTRTPYTPPTHYYDDFEFEGDGGNATGTFPAGGWAAYNRQREAERRAKSLIAARKRRGSKRGRNTKGPHVSEDFRASERMVSLIRANSFEIADLLEELGFAYQDLLVQVLDKGGNAPQ